MLVSLKMKSILLAISVALLSTASAQLFGRSTARHQNGVLLGYILSLKGFGGGGEGHGHGHGHGLDGGYDACCKHSLGWHWGKLIVEPIRCAIS